MKRKRPSVDETGTLDFLFRSSQAVKAARPTTGTQPGAESSMAVSVQEPGAGKVPAVLHAELQAGEPASMQTGQQASLQAGERLNRSALPDLQPASQPARLDAVLQDGEVAKESVARQAIVPGSQAASMKTSPRVGRSAGQQANMQSGEQVSMHSGEQVSMQSGKQASMQNALEASMQGGQQGGLRKALQNGPQEGVQNARRDVLQSRPQDGLQVDGPTGNQSRKATGRHARKEELKQLSEKLLEEALPDGAGLGKYTTYMMPEQYMALQRLKLELQALAPRKGDKDDPRKRGIDVAALLRHAMTQTYGHLLDLD